MKIETVANSLKELGHPIRLAIYKNVVKAGYQGISVGGLQKQLQIPSSTLSYHLSCLISVGLLSQWREGRTLYCIAEYQYLNNVIDFLKEECCAYESRS